MRITDHPEVDAMGIRLHETTITTKHLREAITSAFDGKGNLAGIEILDVLRRLGIRHFYASYFGR